MPRPSRTCAFGASSNASYNSLSACYLKACCSPDNEYMNFIYCNCRMKNYIVMQSRWLQKTQLMQLLKESLNFFRFSFHNWSCTIIHLFIWSRIGESPLLGSFSCYRLWNIASSRTMQLTSMRSTLLRLTLTHQESHRLPKPSMCSGNPLKIIKHF